MTAVIDRPRPAQRPRVPAAISRLTRQAADHARATAQRLSGSLLTAVGLGCIDVGAFEANTVAGWIVTGLSVLALDWVRE